MFDFSRITEIAGSFGVDAKQFLPGEAAQLLENLGLEPGALQGLGMDEIAQVLQERGLDISQLDPQMLTNLVSSLGGESPVGGLIQEGLNRFMR